MAEGYTISDITRETGKNCVSIYTRLKQLGLENKEKGHRYVFTRQQFKRITKSLNEDKRFKRKYSFSPEDRAFIDKQLARGLTQAKIAQILNCDYSTISKHKKRKQAKEQKNSAVTL